MKIALLNLTLDNNYGGNLQRFALTSILQSLGYEVEHINLRFPKEKIKPVWKAPWIIFRRIIYKIIKDHSYTIFKERNINIRRELSLSSIYPFYNKFIPHTNPIYNKAGLKKLKQYDAYIVGSDQVWRKTIAKPQGISTYFFDFLTKKEKPLLAFAVSFGNDKNELNEHEILLLGDLYKRFKGVSVREKSSLELLKSYGWTNPQAIQLNDPTLLLTKDIYSEIIDKSETSSVNGNIFCYILDPTEEKKMIIQNVVEKSGGEPFDISINRTNCPSIEQWLRSFRDAEYIITDSYHGLLFSIIYNKPYLLIRNDFRGNARFDSILKFLNLTDNELERTDWTIINETLKKEKERSLNFIMQNLKQ